MLIRNLQSRRWTRATVFASDIARSAWWPQEETGGNTYYASASTFCQSAIAIAPIRRRSAAMTAEALFAGSFAALRRRTVTAGTAAVSSAALAALRIRRALAAATADSAAVIAPLRWRGAAAGAAGAAEFSASALRQRWSSPAIDSASGCAADSWRVRLTACAAAAESVLSSITIRQRNLDAALQAEVGLTVLSERWRITHAWTDGWSAMSLDLQPALSQNLVFNARMQAMRFPARRRPGIFVARDGNRIASTRRVDVFRAEIPRLN